MRSLTIVRGILAGASALVVAAALIVAQPANPAAAQSSDAAVRQTVRTAHAEAFEALRTGSTAPLRSYSRNAAIQIAEQLNAVRDLGVTVVNAGEPRFEDIDVEGGSATVVTTTTLRVSYYGLFTDSITVEITWYLVSSGGRWIVDGAEIYF